MGEAEPTRKVVEPLPPGWRIPKVEGGGKREPVWIRFFMDDAISMEFQWRKNGERCRALTASLADANLQAMGERREGGGSLLPRKKILWAAYVFIVIRRDFT